MKIFASLILVLFMISCSQEAKQHEVSTQEEIDEIIDIRIYPGDKVRFNGKWMSESGLYSHIHELNITEKSRARIVFEETATFGVVTHSQKLLHEKGLQRIVYTMLSPADFREYNESKIHIDILNSGDVLLEGNKVHTDDLAMALNNLSVPNDMEMMVTVSDEATFGTVTDVTKVLAMNGLRNISTQEFPDAGEHF